MAKKKYRVTLTETEREQLTAIVNRGKHSSQKRKRATLAYTGAKAAQHATIRPTLKKPNLNPGSRRNGA